MHYPITLHTLRWQNSVLSFAIRRLLRIRREGGVGTTGKRSVIFLCSVAVVRESVICLTSGVKFTQIDFPWSTFSACFTVH